MENITWHSKAAENDELSAQRTSTHAHQETMSTHGGKAEEQQPR